MESSYSLKQQKEATSLTSRVILIAFCLAAGLAYRIIIGLLPASVVQLAVLLGFAALLLVAAILAKRLPNLEKYWEIPFAFFIFTVAGILGDSNSYGSLQQAFVVNVLHETPSANNPIASTVLGMVLGQLAGTIALTVPIILLTQASGSDLKSIFIDKPRNRWPLVVGILGFLVVYGFVASGRAQRFFPNSAVTPSRFLALTPAIVILVLCNGLREELFFRGLFLKKYEKFIGPLTSNIVTAVVFASFHVAVTYSSSLPLFLLTALVLGLFLGYLTQKSGSLIPSIIFHAGTDIPIFLVYLSYVSK